MKNERKKEEMKKEERKTNRALDYVIFFKNKMVYHITNPSTNVAYDKIQAEINNHLMSYRPTKHWV